MIAEDLQKVVTQEQQEQQQLKHRIFVCSGTACLSAHSDQIQTALESEIETKGTRCGLCH